MILALRLLRRKNSSGNVEKGPIEESTGQYTTANHANAAEEAGAEEHAELGRRSPAEIDSHIRFEAHG